MFDKLLGINWRTTLAGIMAIVAALSRIAIAYRTRDFEAIFTDGQFILTTVFGIIVGLGLLKAKDQNVTGAGPVAVTVTADGSATDRKGEDVGTVKTAATEQAAIKP